ncbi:hypothetical protein ACSFV5_03775 [Acinetobacter sp. HC8-3S]
MKSGAFCLKIAQLYDYCRAKKENGRYPCMNLDKNAIFVVRIELESEFIFIGMIKFSRLLGI